MTSKSEYETRAGLTRALLRAARQLPGAGVALTLALSVACAGDESVLDEQELETNPACVGREGFALSDAPPVFTLTDIQYTLGALAQLQAAVTPLVQMGKPPEPLFTDYWTNWSAEQDMRIALAKLGVMRGILDKANLWDQYLNNINPLIPGGGTMPQVACGPETATNRTIDGTCNDLTQTSMGARGVRFGRNIQPFLGQDPTTGALIKNPAAQSDPTKLLSPSPREVSRWLFTPPGPGGDGFRKEVPFLNMFAAAWIQFQVHDWFDHGDSEMLNPIVVPLNSDDPLAKQYKIKSLLVPRTKADTSRTPTDNALLPPTFQNDVTHWWDGSQIYGSDLATANRLREGVGGRLKVDANGLLPKASDGFEDTGFRKNWWVGLGVMHNLFAKEHNAIANMLAAKHPDWTDQQLYDKARMINAALIVKIHTVEWTPAILPNKTLEVGMNANWYGLEKFIAWPTPGGQPIPPAQLQASMGLSDEQFKDVKPIIYGIAGGDRDLKTNPSTGQPVPYSLTQEFVSVYRMHPLLPNSFIVRSASTGSKVGDYTMQSARNAGARYIIEKHGLRDIAYTMGREHPYQLTLNNYPKFIQDLDIPLFGKMDMGTIDILRDRERGIPRYNDFRKNLRMKPITKFEDITSDPAVIANLKKVYGTDADAVNRMDALVGTLAEATRPTCYGFGETLFQVFTVMATRRIQADRFLTTDYRPEVYTQEGIDWVEQNSMKTVLLRHFPELSKSGLATVANAFYPWQ